MRRIRERRAGLEAEEQNEAPASFQRGGEIHPLGPGDDPLFFAAAFAAGRFARGLSA